MPKLIFRACEENITSGNTWSDHTSKDFAHWITGKSLCFEFFSLEDVELNLLIESCNDPCKRTLSGIGSLSSHLWKWVWNGSYFTALSSTVLISLQIKAGSSMHEVLEKTCQRPCRSSHVFSCAVNLSKRWELRQWGKKLQKEHIYSLKTDTYSQHLCQRRTMMLCTFGSINIHMRDFGPENG